MSDVLDVNFKRPVGLVDCLQLNCALQPVGAGEGGQGQVLAVLGFPVHCLEDDLHLVIVPHCGAGGDYASDSQLGWAVLDYGGVYLWLWRLRLPSTPGEHLVLVRVWDREEGRANLCSGFGVLTGAVPIHLARTESDHILLLHDVVELNLVIVICFSVPHFHPLLPGPSLSCLSMFGQQVWVWVFTVLVFFEVLRSSEI